MKIRKGFVSNSSSTSFVLYFNMLPNSKLMLSKLLDETMSTDMLDCIWNKLSDEIDILNKEYSASNIVQSECLNAVHTGIDKYFNEHSLDMTELVNKSLSTIIGNMMKSGRYLNIIELEFSGGGDYETPEEDYVYKNGHLLFKSLLKNRV